MRMFGSPSERTVHSWFLVALAELLIVATPALAETGPRRFTVADDIALNQLQPEIVFSPDDRFFVVVSERGRLDLNRVESTLRVYSTEDIRKLLAEPDAQQEPSPLWSINKSTYTEGSIISNVRWLDDSSGFMFLAKPYVDAKRAAAFLANPFLSPVIRLQTERGHRVFQNGPYPLMRHPGYFAMCTSAPASALAIGSWLALAPAAGFTVVIVRRARLEDEFLTRNLPGYKTYASLVPRGVPSRQRRAAGKS